MSITKNQKGNNTLIAIIVVIVLAVIIYFVTKPATPTEVMDNNMTSDSQEMMEDDSVMKNEADTMENNQMMESESMMKDDNNNLENNSMMEDKPTTDNSAMDQSNTGKYETYAENKLTWAENGDVVLFFHASWCPTCKALENNINANLSEIPENTYILKTNYDTETELKKKYGITYQHTFVQVDSKGNQIKKWSGSPTLAALVGQIQ